MSLLCLALLHLAPRLGDLAYNRQLVETAVTTAAGLGAQWIITPELCLCGYQFTSRIGSAWIEPQPDAWMRQFSQLVARLRVTVFLSHPERDRDADKCYNTVFVIGVDGTCVGVHRKVHVVPGAEAWASPGQTAVPVFVPPLHIGILVCADAYTSAIAKHLQAQGAQLLISSAAWPPWPHGPDGAWERCSRDTGLPLFVCNRTGTDQSLSFLEAESVVVKDGERLLAFRAPHSTLLLVDWDVQAQALVNYVCQSLPS
jgi:5-aminopentanamidase